MGVTGFFVAGAMGARQSVQILLWGTLHLPSSLPEYEMNQQSSDFSGRHLHCPAFWRTESLVYTLVFKLCSATVSCSCVTFGSWGSKTPLPQGFKHCVWRGRGQGEAPGLQVSVWGCTVHEARMSFRLWKSETVGLNYLFNSIFPILSVPKISCSHGLARTWNSKSRKSSSRLRELRRQHIPCWICRHKSRMCS